ncbi:MAG: GIN domain-containing protein [Myxococcaceae bacterium]
MKRATLMLLMLCLPGCGLVSGNGHLQSQEHERTGFSRVRSSGQFEVMVRDQADCKVVVTGDSNLLEYVSTRVEGDTLVIDEAHNGVWLMNSNVRVEVSLPVALSLDASGAGSLWADLTSTGGDLEVIHSGAGDVSVSGSFANLTTTTTGAGSDTWTGTATAWTAAVEGVGSVNARELSVDDAYLTSSGVGSLKATVQRTLAASVSDLGSIEWWGPAQVTASNRTGPGNIIHR